MADQKLEKCKTPSGDELDRHCVGRITGQMMQLIAAVENVNHQPMVHNHRSADYWKGVFLVYNSETNWLNKNSHHALKYLVNCISKSFSLFSNSTNKY